VHKAPNFVGVWERMFNNFIVSIMVKEKKRFSFKVGVNEKEKQ